MKSKNSVTFGLVVIVAFLAFGGIWYARTDKEKNVSDGEKLVDEGKIDVLSDREMLEVIGYSAESELDSLVGNFPNGEKYVSDVKNVLQGLREEMFVYEPDVYDAYLTVAVALNVLKEPDRSIQVYNAILKLNPNHPVALNNLARIYLDKTEYDKVEEYYVRLIDNNPTWSQGYSDLADVYRAFLPEKKEKIPEIFEEALAENPSRIPLLMYLAEYYEDEKNFPKAREYYQKVLEQNAQNTDAIAGLKRIGQ